MKRGIPTMVLAAATVLAGSLALAADDDEEQVSGKGEKVDGYAEWRSGDCLIVDAQRVCPGPVFKFKGEAEAKDFTSIPYGYEVKAKGKRQADGSLLAKEAEAKPNGSAMFETDVRAATDQAESQARRNGYFGDGNDSAGRLIERGPQADRVRRIVDTLLPPYLHPEDVRTYVIENKEWNAFAMGNYSIYVFSGLLDDLDDDEVAIVLGHELVHASHEHSRKQFKRDMWVQLLTAGALAASSSIDDDTKRAVAGLVVLAGSTAYRSGYGRGMEDQADRVGLRYAYEAGYDISKGPRLWNRFAKKYGEGNKVANFFFSDHSQSAARATKLEREIAYNYPEGPKPDGPARMARRTPPSERNSSAPSRLPAPATGTVQALTATAPATSGHSAAPATTERKEITSGMTTAQVRKILGDPRTETIFGEKTRWKYSDLTVVFVQGKVTDVQF